MHQDSPVTFESEIQGILGQKMAEYANQNQSIDMESPEFLKQFNGWAEDARKQIRKSVYQEAMQDLLAAGVKGIKRRDVGADGEIIPTRERSDGRLYDESGTDVFGELYADDDSSAHEFAVIRQNMYERGRPMMYWDEWEKNRPSKLGAAVRGGFIDASLAWEGGARGIGQYVAKVGADLAMPDRKVAEAIGIDPLELMMIRKSGAANDRQRDALRKYDEIKGSFVTDYSNDHGAAWAGAARFLSNIIPYSEPLRTRLMGSDPENVEDIRDFTGRAGGGLAVKAGEMTGSAMGIIPYSVPALLARNPRIAALLTTPFYAMGHSDAWNRRMEIYKDQLLHARSNGLPEPARPSYTDLSQQSRMSGAIEFGSEYAIDRLQAALPAAMNWVPSKANRISPSTLKSAKAYGRDLLTSLSRRHGVIGALKAPIVAAAGGVTEAIEEAIPEAGKEIIDPLYIPDGYENDFFSADTAEAMGTGLIAGLLTTGGAVAVKSALPGRRKEKEAARRAAGFMAGVIENKAARLATDRLVQNSTQAYGPTMALHQLDEIQSGDRSVIFIDQRNKDKTLTPDVRQRMDALEVGQKPIGMVGNFSVYAQNGRVEEAREAIRTGNIAALTGHQYLKDPKLPAVGAMVVRNKAEQIVEVIPYSSTDEAKAALPDVEFRAARYGYGVTMVDGSQLPAISESLEQQAVADITMRGLEAPKRKNLAVDKARGIKALHLELATDAHGSRESQKQEERLPSAPFTSSYLTAQEIGDATNADVEVDTRLFEVNEKNLSKNEKRIALSTGINPTILDGSVTFRINRKNGKVDVYEKPINKQGAYLGQQSPDGVFLIRENGTAFTARNALAIMLHELRHQLVGRSRGGAQLVAQLMYLDPVLAMRGGLEYVREAAPEEFATRDKHGNIVIMDDLAMLGRMAALYSASESILTDPTASAEDKAEAMRQREKVEMLAEESAATAIESSTGQVLTKAVEFDAIYKNQQGISAAKLAAWMASKLAKAGWAGPWAKQALFEIQQRMQGKMDEELLIHQQMQSELTKQYMEDAEEFSKVMEGSRSQSAPAVGSIAAAAGGPLAALAGGDDDEKVADASKALADYSAKGPEEKSQALSSAISALASALPVLASATATTAGVGGKTRGVSPEARQAPAVGVTPQEVQAETEPPAPEAPQTMNEAEREILERQRAEGTTMFAQRPSQRVEFFSALQRAVSELPDQTLSASGWKQRIRSMVNKGQVKQAEVDWSGFEDYLALPRDEKKLTRDEVYRVATTNFQIDRIDASPVTLTTDDVRKDVNYVIARWEDRLSEEMARKQGVPLEDFDLPMEIRRDIKAVYDGRLVPGDADNNAYWEFDSEAENRLDDLAWNLNLPSISGELGDSIDFDAEQDSLAPNYEAYTLPGGTNYRQTVLAVPNDFLSKNPDVSTYESPHWGDISNPIAHIRTKDRVSADGAKVLFVEELQSDWAQAGRKRGFQSEELPELPKATRYFNPGEGGYDLATVQLPDSSGGFRYGGTFYQGRTIEEATYEAQQYLQRWQIARGPFVTSTDGWLNLGLKSVIIDAINGGYDRVAFVNGKQSVDRYDLSKKVDSIVYRKNQDGTFDIDAIKDSSVPFSRKNVNPSDLSGLVGEQIAEKMESGQGESASDYPAEYRELSGVDLKVGGEGMIDFYENIVPAAVNKLLKKIGGGKASVVDAGTEDQQLGFDVTDAMRKSVTDAGGMAMFARRRDIEENWVATSKAVDDGELTTVYVGNPTGFMEFDSQRMGRTDRPVSIGAATSSATADGMWFTDIRDRAETAAQIKDVDIMPQLARILNAKTKILAKSMPESALDAFEDNNGLPLEEYRLTAEDMDDVFGDEVDDYEGMVRYHADFIAEMMDNDPAAIAKIDQAFSSDFITKLASDLAGSRGGVMRAAHLKLENPLIVPFKKGELISTERGVIREDEPFVTQASDAIDQMRENGNDGIIMQMDDGERRYFVRNPSQVQVIGAARDAREASMFAMRGKPADPSGGVGRSLAADAIRELKATEEEIKATVLDRMKGGSKQDTFLPEQVGGITSIVRYLGDRRKASGLKKLDVMNPNDHVPIMRLMVLEGVAHIKAAKDALQWYDSTVRSMLAQAALIHPELATDKNAQMVFSIGLAISSQGQNVEDNIAVALSLYDSYKASIDPATGIGQFGDGLTKGTKKASQNKNLKLANTMLREIGLEGMRTFLAKQYTVKELRALGYKPGGELVDEALLGSSVFGPKIGFGFLSNLMGNFDPITMDMWFMRTVLRLAGSLSKFNPKTYAKQRARFLEGVAEIKQPEGPNGIYASDIDQTLVARATAPNARESSVRALAKAVMSAHEKDFKNNRAEYDSGARKQTQMVLAAKTIVGSIDKPRDVAKSGRERHNLRAIVRLAVAETNRITGLKIPHAAFQALIWYPEQELFKSLGAKLKVTSQDYAGAMTKELKKRGIPDARINAAIASANPPALEPSGTGGPGGPRGSGVRPAARAAARPMGRIVDGRADGAVRPADQGQSGDRGVESQFSMRRGARGVRDEATLRYIDKFDELLRYVRIAEQSGTELRGIANPYTGARILGGVLGAMQLRAEARYADILRRMHLAGVTTAEMDRFLLAQHAEERNRYVASINPAFPDGGSGMTTTDARNYLAMSVASGRFPVLDGFANEWRAMLNESLVMRRDAGIVSQEMFDALNSRYKRYVPLRGAPAQVGDEDFEGWGEPGGSGLSTTGRGVPRALGRRSEALGVTSQVAYVHEDSFRRVQRNQIGQAFLGLVLAVGDVNMAQVIRPRRRVLQGGTVRYVHDMGWMQDPRNFGVYVNEPMTIGGHNYEPGDLVVIRINNRRLADAMTTPTLELRSFERALTNVNNVWRFMTTGMGNPAFAPVNMIRDVGQATLNNLARRGIIDTAQMMSRWPSAFMRVWRDAWFGPRPTGTYAEFVDAGGDMVAWRGNDLDAKRADFEALANRVARRDPNDRGLARTLLGWYSGFFAASETAARLAQFEQRMETADPGLSIEDARAEAALAARDITVDFSKGGLAKPVLNTWYMFLNAGLQGSVNVLGAVARSVTLAPSLLMLGYVQAFMARMMSGDDEDSGQTRWDLVPDYEKTSNLHFYDPVLRSGTNIKVPIPYGYNVFFSAGVRLENVINGRGTVGDMFAGMLTDALNAFNPIGGSGIKGGTTGVLTSILPTAVRPLGELATNQDFAGKLIYPEQYGKYKAPDSSLAFDGTPGGYIATAEWLNEITGGDEFEPGLIDVSPNTLEYLVGYYFSGTGRMLNRIYKFGFSDEETSVNDIPIMRSFIGRSATDTRAISQQYNEIAASMAPTMRRVAVLEDEDAPPELKQRAFDTFDLSKGPLVETLKATDKALSEIRQLLKTAEGQGRQDLLDARRKVQKALIRRKNELTDQLRALE